ncbi:hypothetical protein IV203_009905 [Nitzschia inconspicua]|uniref:Uncharacterized protein n=1 Tax=Nitzschia inconspicua TaxID=303405 RepID=A0A9K3PKD2_9STRA|nr:hypothetical protein IV203_009905 [Nitzschia inconspicua]
MTSRPYNITETVHEELENLEVVIQHILLSTPTSFYDENVYVDATAGSSGGSKTSVVTPVQKQKKKKKFRLRKSLGKILSGSKKYFEESSIDDGVTIETFGMNEEGRSLSTKDSCGIIPEQRDDCGENSQGSASISAFKFETGSMDQTQKSDLQGEHNSMKTYQGLITLDAATFDIETVVEQPSKNEFEIRDVAVSKVEKQVSALDSLPTSQTPKSENEPDGDKRATEEDNRTDLTVITERSNVGLALHGKRQNRTVFRTVSLWMKKAGKKKKEFRPSSKDTRWGTDFVLKTECKETVQSVTECRDILASMSFVPPGPRQQYHNSITGENKLRNRIEDIYNAFRTQKQTRTKVKLMVFSWLLKNGMMLYAKRSPNWKLNAESKENGNVTIKSSRSQAFSEQEILNAGLLVVQRRIDDIFQALNIHIQNQDARLKKELVTKLLKNGVSDSAVSGESLAIITSASDALHSLSSDAVVEDGNLGVTTIVSDGLQKAPTEKSDIIVLERLGEPAVDRLSSEDVSHALIVTKSNCDDGEGFNVIYESCTDLCGMLPSSEIMTDCGIEKRAFFCAAETAPSLVSAESIDVSKFTQLDEEGDAELVDALIELWSSSREENLILTEHKVQLNYDNNTETEYSDVNGVECGESIEEVQRNEDVPKEVVDNEHTNLKPPEQKEMIALSDFFETWGLSGSNSSSLKASVEKDFLSEPVVEVTAASEESTIKKVKTESLPIQEKLPTQSKKEDDFVSTLMSFIGLKRPIFEASANSGDEMPQRESTSDQTAKMFDTSVNDQVKANRQVEAALEAENVGEVVGHVSLHDVSYAEAPSETENIKETQGKTDDSLHNVSSAEAPSETENIKDTPEQSEASLHNVSSAETPSITENIKDTPEQSEAPLHNVSSAEATSETKTIGEAKEQSDVSLHNVSLGSKEEMNKGQFLQPATFKKTEGKQDSKDDEDLQLIKNEIEAIEPANGTEVESRHSIIPKRVFYGKEDKEKKKDDSMSLDEKREGKPVREARGTQKKKGEIKPSKKIRRRRKRVISPRSISSNSYLDPIFEHPEEVSLKASSDPENKNIEPVEQLEDQVGMAPQRDMDLDLVVSYKLESMSILSNENSFSMPDSNDNPKQVRDPLCEISKSSSEEPKLFLSADDSASSGANSFSDGRHQDDAIEEDISTSSRSKRNALEVGTSESLDEVLTLVDGSNLASMDISQTFSNSIGSSFTDRLSTLSSASSTGEKEETVWNRLGFGFDPFRSVDGSSMLGDDTFGDDTFGDTTFGDNTFESSVGSADETDTDIEEDVLDSVGEEAQEQSKGVLDTEHPSLQKRVKQISSGFVGRIRKITAEKAAKTTSVETHETQKEEGAKKSHVTRDHPEKSKEEAFMSQKPQSPVAESRRNLQKDRRRSFLPQHAGIQTESSEQCRDEKESIGDHFTDQNSRDVESRDEDDNPFLIPLPVALTKS